MAGAFLGPASVTLELPAIRPAPAPQAVRVVARGFYEPPSEAGTATVRVPDPLPRDMCRGWAPCLLNLVCCPCVLPLNAVTIYCLPYLTQCENVCCAALCCCCCINGYCDACQWIWRFTDNSAFARGVSGELARSDIIYKSMMTAKIGTQTVAPAPAHIFLFNGPIDPRAVAQGTIGDCWLVSAIVGLSESPGAIRNLFETKAWSFNGKYVVRLFRATTQKWERIVVDDFFPIGRNGLPTYARPAVGRSELWAMVLEKAFAKFCGSYKKLEGGFTLFAMQAMTGSAVYRLVRTGAAWREESIGAWDPRTTAQPRFIFPSGASPLASDAVWARLLRLCARRACVAASIRSSGGEDRTSLSAIGLVAGHAYAVLRAVVVQGIQLLQIRNPWGTYEWSGDWSDRSPMWDRWPAIKRQLLPNGAQDDGAFWMSFQDFSHLFTALDICDRRIDIDELQIDLREDLGACGPVWGCCCGCFCFWCGFQGCCYLYCWRYHSSFDESRPAQKMGAVQVVTGR